MHQMTMEVFVLLWLITDTHVEAGNLHNLHLYSYDLGTESSIETAK